MKFYGATFIAKHETDIALPQVKASESPNDEQRKPHSNHSDRRIAQRREVSYVYVASSIVA